MKPFIVVTSIHEKSNAIAKFEDLAVADIVVIGDEKSTGMESSSVLTYLSLADQAKLDFEYSRVCPVNHYARKNIGYLFSFLRSADLVFDSDDDNQPMVNWEIPKFQSQRQLNCSDLFLNSYRYFSDEHIWPRGFPIDEVQKEQSLYTVNGETVEVGVWQGLADGEPDVDAIFRMPLIEKSSSTENHPFIYRNTYILQ